MRSRTNGRRLASWGAAYGAMLRDFTAELPEPAVERCWHIPERRMAGVAHHMNLRVTHEGPMELDDRRFDDRVLGTVSDQHRFPNCWQQIVIVERTREERLTYPRRHGDVVTEHHREIRLRRLCYEAQSKQRVETLYALFHVGREEARHEREEFRREHRHGRFAAKLGDPTDEVDAANRVLAVVTDVVEDDQWAVRPAAEDRLIEVKLTDCDGDIVRPELGVAVRVARPIGRAVSPHVHGDETVIVGESRVELPTPGERALGEAVD